MYFSERYREPTRAMNAKRFFTENKKRMYSIVPENHFDGINLHISRVIQHRDTATIFSTKVIVTPAGVEDEKHPGTMQPWKLPGHLIVQ